MGYMVKLMKHFSRICQHLVQR